MQGAREGRVRTSLLSGRAPACTPARQTRSARCASPAGKRAPRLTPPATPPPPTRDSVQHATVLRVQHVCIAAGVCICVAAGRQVMLTANTVLQTNS